MIVTLPIPGFVSVICLAVFGLPSDGVQLVPGLPPGLIDLSLYIFGKLFVGNEFFHNTTSQLVVLLYQFDQYCQRNVKDSGDDDKSNHM